MVCGCGSCGLFDCGPLTAERLLPTADERSAVGRRRSKICQARFLEKVYLLIMEV